MTTDKAVDGEFTNPFALAKARAAHEIAMAVAGQNVKGCFMTKEWEKYIPIVASAHEMMRSAVVLCDEARELEKAGDSILRQAHKKDGMLVAKKKLVAKFE
jgi:methylenetetrahydromethanopterin dehydrogenase